MNSNHILLFSVLKLGIRAESIKELFGAGIPGFKGDLSFSDFQALFNVVSIQLRLEGGITGVLKALMTQFSQFRETEYDRGPRRET